MTTMMCVCFCFCKQKTAYEMRMSDCSSDVCSSDLAKAQGALKATVLVQHHPRRDQRRPWQMIGEPVGAIAIFAQVQHARYPRWRRWRARTGAKSGSRLAAKTASVWPTDRTSVGLGKRVSVRLDLGGRRIIKKKRLKKHV